MQEETATETAGETETATNGGSVEAAPRRGWLSRLMPLFAIAVALLAVVIAGVSWWQSIEFRADRAVSDQAVLGRLEDTRSALSRVADDVDSVRAELAAGGAEVDALADDLEALPAEIRSIDRRVEALQGGRLDARDVWLRQQAEYYLTVANTELALSGHVDQAITALELADDVLRDLGDPSLGNVRRAIASGQQSLRALELPDLEGIAAELGGLLDRLADLPMRAAAPDNFAAAEPEEDLEPGLGRLWAQTRGAVTSIVRIERQDEPVGPVLTEAERVLIRRQLALEVQFARTALLEKRQEAFRASLVAADGLLNQAFDRSAEPIVETRRLLGELMRVDLHPPLPDISDSLTLLRNAPGGI